MHDLSSVAASVGSLPQTLVALLAHLDHETLSTRPEPGEWSVLEVIGHLIECDGVAFRTRIQDIVDGKPKLSPFDAWEAINRRDFKSLSLDTLMGELKTERSFSVDFVLGLDVITLDRTVSHAGEDFAASDFLFEWSFHDRDHVQQILEILKQGALPLMSDSMQKALRK